MALCEILVNGATCSVEKQGSLTPQLNVVSATPGTDLVLGLDFDVQKVAEEAVWDQRASVVALIDPQSGDVIAGQITGLRPNPVRARPHGAGSARSTKFYRPAAVQPRCAALLSRRARRSSRWSLATGLTYGLATPGYRALLPRLVLAAQQQPPFRDYKPSGLAWRWSARSHDTATSTSRLIARLQADAARRFPTKRRWLGAPA